MHDLAVMLNETLKGSCAYELLSDYGLRMYVPKGIIVQSAEAKQKATRFNATIGVALENGTAMYIPAMKAQFAPTMKVGEIFPYAPMGGLPALRKLWKEDMIAKNPILEGKPISLPIVTSGLTNSLSIACSLFVEIGGDVILPDLYWENYNLILDEQRQANKILFPLFRDNAFNKRCFHRHPHLPCPIPMPQHSGPKARRNPERSHSSGSAQAAGYFWLLGL